MAIARIRPFPVPDLPTGGPWKAADVERFPDDGYQYEIWRGELIRTTPAGGRPGECEANLVAALRQNTRRLGRVYTGDTGFLLHETPDVLVSPDVAFVRHDRLPPPAARTSYLRVIPDLVVEIRSPNDRETDVRDKIDLYTAAGVRVIWLVDPQPEAVEELGILATDPPRLLRISSRDTLDGGEAVPGCRIPLTEVFD